MCGEGGDNVFFSFNAIGKHVNGGRMKGEEGGGSRRDRESGLGKEEREEGGVLHGTRE